MEKMITCPKCSRLVTSRPHYMQIGVREVLRTHCSFCGYAMDEPCADAKNHPLSDQVAAELAKIKSAAPGAG